ncbi:hypothetical protein ACOMHN_012192 [Nucella lapillus]
MRIPTYRDTKYQPLQLLSDSPQEAPVTVPSFLPGFSPAPSPPDCHNPTDNPLADGEEKGKLPGPRRQA